MADPIEFYPARDGSGASARFYDAPASDEKGAPMVVLMEVALVNSKDRPCYVIGADDESEAYKKRFHKAWSAYKGGKPVKVEGTAIEELQGLTPRRAAQWRANGILTIEDFAALEEGQAMSFGTGAITLLKRARAMKDALKENAQEKKIEALVEEKLNEAKPKKTKDI